MKRRHGSMSFHMTQVLTGHGCFAKYLPRIGRRAVTDCDFCGEEDGAMHTIRDCPNWDCERFNLRKALKLKRDFSLADIIEAILAS